MGEKDVSPNTKLGVLAVLVVQNCSLILMMRYSRVVGDPHARYIISTAVVLSELLKLLTSLLVLYSGKLKSSLALSRGWDNLAVLTHIIRTDFIANSMEMLKLAVPAGLYVVQNNLQYLSASNLPASVFQVLSQLKIVTTAFFSVCMLSRRLSPQQWISILCLSGGVGLVQLSQSQEGLRGGGSGNERDSYMLGLTCVLFSCLTSGFAGVYFEKVLKSGGGRISLWLRNVHLSMIGVCLSVAVCYFRDYEEIASSGFFKGYDGIVWTVILLQAGGGLVVATVVMYADNVLKGFATSFSVVLSCIISSMFLEDQNLNTYFICGAIIVVASALMYSLFPYTAPITQRKQTSASSMSSSWSAGDITREEHDEEVAGHTGDNQRLIDDDRSTLDDINSNDNNVDKKGNLYGTVNIHVDKNREQVSLEQRANVKKKHLSSPITV